MCWGYLLLLITVVCFHPLPALFKCCHCMLLKSAKRPEHGRRTKRWFSHQKKCHKPAELYGSFHSTDWHLQRWNLNFMSGKELISGTTKPFAPRLWGYERWYSCCIQLSSVWGQWNQLNICLSSLWLFCYLRRHYKWNQMFHYCWHQLI